MWLVCSIHHVQAQYTWPFKVNDTVELLGRFLKVIGGDGGVGDAEDDVTSSLAPFVADLLEKRCMEIVRTLPEKMGDWPRGNKLLRALTVIRE